MISFRFCLETWKNGQSLYSWYSQRRHCVCKRGINTLGLGHVKEISFLQEKIFKRRYSVLLPVFEGFLKHGFINELLMKFYFYLFTVDINIQYILLHCDSFTLTKQLLINQCTQFLIFGSPSDSKGDIKLWRRFPGIILILSLILNCEGFLVLFWFYHWYKIVKTASWYYFEFFHSNSS